MLMAAEPAAALIKARLARGDAPDRLPLAALSAGARLAGLLPAWVQQRADRRAGPARSEPASQPPACAQLAPAGDVAVVLGQGAGESVAAVAVGDEVEIVDRRRVPRRRQRARPGIGDRPGRQARDAVGVVGVVDLRGRRGSARGRADPCPRSGRRSRSGSVCSGMPWRRRLTNTAATSAILLGLGRLLLDDRGQDQRLLAASAAAGRAGARPRPGPAPPSMPLRIRSTTGRARLAARDQVGVGQQAALGRQRPAARRSSTSAAARSAVDLVHGQALRHRDRMQDAPCRSRAAP